MRNFLLYRKEDETGISGTGLVAVGVFNNLEDLLRIHGHQGKTKAVWHSNEHLLFNERDFE